MGQKGKLELTWIGKENRPRLEPRILLENPEKSYHAKGRVSENDILDNRLIFGDNLLALKALEQEFAGKVKCVFIDPPYNTGSAFTHYDDGVEHSIWLGLMRDRLDLIRRLLAEDGPLWITVDNNEAHYLKVLCDEVFATNSGDLVLNSFAGSGTTGAVAHKMGRRWIMVELGEHAHTHIIPRLKKVIDGEDPGGITENVNWRGGGGFRYYRLAPSLLELDQFGNAVISKQYNAPMLAEAMCKLMGFQYAPSETVYWQHGSSTENDFIYVTTQTLSREQLAKLSDAVGADRSLLVCCSAYRAKADAFPNLELQKIPQTVLNRCEWGKDDYSLNVANLPMNALPEPEPVITSRNGKPQKRDSSKQQPVLFGGDNQ